MTILKRNYNSGVLYIIIICLEDADTTKIVILKRKILI